MLKISTMKTRFVDALGRERIFNGVNLCDKGRKDTEGAHRSYDLDFDETLIAQLAACGFNLVRLGLTWDAVEPQPRQYDEAYLDRVERVADLCAKHGIYFFLDMHQDLYSAAKGCDGDGAPEWACLTDGAKYKPARFVWAEGYFWGKATQRSFDHFWANTQIDGTPIQTYYADMWKHVADRFKDHPALFGYDLLNEPYPGTAGGKVFRSLIARLVKVVITDKRCKLLWMAKQVLTGNAIRCLEPFNDPSLFRKVTSAGDALIRKFDTGVYSAFLSRVTKAIREVTENGIIIMENSYYSNLGIPYSAPPVTVDGKQEPQLCFAPHAYDLMVDTPAYKYASNSRVGAIFDEHRRSQERLSIPLLVGEWGGQSEGTDWLFHIDYLLAKFNGYHWGQTYWCYYPGLLENPIMTRLKRPTPVAVCGEIKDYSYDPAADVFTLSFAQDRAYDAPTEIFLHKPAAEIVCDGTWTLTEKGDGAALLSVETAPGLHSIRVQF